MSRQSILKIHSTISPSLMRYTVLKGTLVASLGGLLLVYCGGFLPPSQLSRWGIFIWTAGFALIAYGLVPYKSLMQLIAHPNEIILDDKDHLHFMSRKKHQFAISTDSIQELNYKEGRLKYGVQIRLKHKNRWLFLPYFSKKSYEKLKDALFE